MAIKLDVEGPDKNGDYRIYEPHTGSRLMIYEGPNPMHHLLQLQQTLGQADALPTTKDTEE